jgi:alpha(1,3/1,4) fucosyltransferase
MKKIFIQVANYGLANNRFFAEDQSNKFIPPNMSDPWRIAKERLRDIGYEIMTADNNDIKDCERIIFMDAISVEKDISPVQKFKNLIKRILGRKIAPIYPTRKLYKEALENNMENKMVLCMWENRAVRPANFDPANWAKFKKIMTWDDDLIDNKKFFKFSLPIPVRTPLEGTSSFANKKLLVNMSYNKYSSYHAELYSVRRKSIGYFDANYPEDFDLYGPRWNQPITRLQNIFPFLVKKYSTYRGSSEDKLKTISQYKFTLAYENNGDAKGYVTEKMFDALYAKTVPVYLGAPNVAKYVPSEVFIDRRQFKNDEDLAKFLKGITESEYQKYIEAGEKYLRSENYAKLSPEYFYKELIRILQLK